MRQSEVEIIKGLNHPFVIHLLDSFQSGAFFYIVYESPLDCRMIA